MGKFALPPEPVLAELKQRAQWVIWEQRADGRKVPIDPHTGNSAKVNDPATWGAFEQAYQGEGRPIGFVFTDSDPYVGIDYDDCRNPQTGGIHSEVLRQIQALNSYAEVSPSGKGVKQWVKGDLPEGGVKGVLNGVQVEAYSSARYFTVTGWHLAGTPTTIEPAQGALDDLVAGIVRGDGGKDEQAGEVSDDVPEGQRNSFLTSLAGKMRREGCTEEEVLALLLGVNARRCKPPLDEAEVARVAASVCRYSPKGDSSLDPMACPDLPKSVGLDSTLGHGVGAWLDVYVEHANAVSPMTPSLFHQFAGLWVLSLVVARRLAVIMPYGLVYPNLWGLWLARTTLFRKSTGLNIARDLVELVCSYLLLPNEATPEALLSSLAGREPSKLSALPQSLQDEWTMGRNFAAQRGLVRDEISSLMASSTKDYNAGLVETFLRLYDCDAKYTRETRMQGLITIRSAYLSLLGASTPAAMSRYLTDRLYWENGWWPRYALLTPEVERPEWAESAAGAVLIDPNDSMKFTLTDLDLLSKEVRELLHRLPPAEYGSQVQCRMVRLGVGTEEAWVAYSKALSYDLITDNLDDRLAGVYGRLPTHLVKVATLLAALDWPKDAEAPTIELPHLARAMEIVEQWRASAHRTLLAVMQRRSDNRRERVLRIIARRGAGGCSLREIVQAMKDTKRDELERVIRGLMDDGEIERFEYQNPNGGPRSARFRVVTE